MIREGFWLHPLVPRGFIFGPAITLRAQQLLRRDRRSPGFRRAVCGTVGADPGMPDRLGHEEEARGGLAALAARDLHS